MPNILNAIEYNKLGEKDKETLVSLGITEIETLVNYFNRNCKSDQHITFNELTGLIIIENEKKGPIN